MHGKVNKGIQNMLFEYVSDNLLSSFWSLMLVIGGSVFITYYAQINYLPSLDVMSSITLIAATSITAIVVCLGGFVLFVIPGVVWKLFFMRGVAIGRKVEISVGDAHKQWIGKMFALPFFAWLCAIGAWALWRDMEKKGWANVDQILLVGVILAALLAVFLHLYLSCNGVLRELKCKAPWKRLIRRVRIHFWMVFSSGLCVYAAIFPILIFLKEPDDLASKDGWALMWFLTIIIYITSINVAVIAKPIQNSKIKQGAAISFLIILILGTYSKVLPKIPGRIMASYQLGDIKNVDVVLEAEGCKDLVALSLPLEWSNNSRCVLKSVHILSRLGTEYYIDYNSKKFTVRSEHVKNFSSTER